MYSYVKTAVLSGIDAVMVDAEADVSDGLPCIDMVGFMSGEVGESKERIRTALKNNGISLPAKRVTINLAPASVKKSGSGLDLPIAVSILTALGIISQNDLSDFFIVGELRLDGAVSGVKGVLSCVLKAKEEGLNKCIVPMDNLGEARLVTGIDTIGVRHLMDAVAVISGDKPALRQDGEYIEEELDPETLSEEQLIDTEKVDFSDIRGQQVLRRACEIAVAGMHNFLMTGPPGAGKTMVAKRIPTILPPLLPDERLEVSKIYSVCGLMEGKKGLISDRPIRAPHHTVSAAGMSGGGSEIKPGEVSLAHKGVLYLDELPEFAPSALETLREPLEDRKIRITRAMNTVEYPADILLCSSMNPCKCGYYPSSRCTCSPLSVTKYRSRISKPLMDRIDIVVEAAAVSFDELSGKGLGESSAEIRKRVVKCHKLQQERYAGYDINFNSRLDPTLVQKFCELGYEEKALMENMFSKLRLTARSYHKILKVARTIADLDESEKIQKKHLCEALCYRANMEGGAGR